MNLFFQPFPTTQQQTVAGPSSTPAQQLVAPMDVGGGSTLVPAQQPQQQNPLALMDQLTNTPTDPQLASSPHTVLPAATATLPSAAGAAPTQSVYGVSSPHIGGVGALPGGVGNLEDRSVRRSLLVEYYRYLYRFIPVLLPPDHLESLVSTFDARSPFLLALQCILPLLRDEEQPPGPLHGLGGSGLNFGSPEKKAYVREVTAICQRRATEAIDLALERAEEADHDADAGQRGRSGSNTTQNQQGASQASTKIILEVVQALCVLIIYEVSHR